MTEDKRDRFAAFVAKAMMLRSLHSYRNAWTRAQDCGSDVSMYPEPPSYAELSTEYDERMHGSPFFHATNIRNAPATNLVQVGIGGWTGSKPGMRVARERQATVITVEDIDGYGVERIMEYALEIAWQGAQAVWISFDIDSDVKYRLMNGLDDIGMTFERAGDIDRYERERERPGPVTTGL